MRGLEVFSRREASRRKTVPKKMKRFAQVAERACAPASRLAARPGWVRWSGVVLSAYTAAWFALALRLIAH